MAAQLLTMPLTTAFTRLQLDQVQISWSTSLTQRLTTPPVTKFIVLNIGYSWLRHGVVVPACQLMELGGHNLLMLESTLFPQSGTMNSATEDIDLRGKVTFMETKSAFCGFLVGLSLGRLIWTRIILFFMHSVHDLGLCLHHADSVKW